MKKIALAAISLSLGGCSGTPIEVTPPPQIQVYHPPSPAPVETRQVQWEVLTREQLIDLVRQSEQTKQPITLYALRQQGFENLAINIQELKRYILESRAVIDYYRGVLPQDTDEATEEVTRRQRSITIERSTITPHQRTLTEKLYNFK